MSVHSFRPQGTPTTASSSSPNRPSPRGLVHQMIQDATADQSLSSPAAQPDRPTEDIIPTKHLDDPNNRLRRGYAPSSQRGGLRLFSEPKEVSDIDEGIVRHLASYTFPPLTPQGQAVTQPPDRSWTQSPGTWTLNHLDAWGTAMRQTGSEEDEGIDLDETESQEIGGPDVISLVDLETQNLGSTNREMLATSILRQAARSGRIGESLVRLARNDEALAKTAVRLTLDAILFMLPEEIWSDSPAPSSPDGEPELETSQVPDEDVQSDPGTSPTNPMMLELQSTSGPRRRAARTVPYDQPCPTGRRTRPMRPARRSNRDTEY
jgi:hypothetical protein